MVTMDEEATLNSHDNDNLCSDVLPAEKDIEYVEWQNLLSS